VQWPDPATPVLAGRKLNPSTDPATLSAFADDQWNLTPGLFEAHATTTRLNLRSVPAPLRDPVKHYLWQMINRAPARRQQGDLQAQLALSTLPLLLPRLTAFALWLYGHHVGSFGAVTEQHRDSYLSDVVNSETPASTKPSCSSRFDVCGPTESSCPNRCGCPPPLPGVGSDRETCSACGCAAE